MEFRFIRRNVLSSAVRRTSHAWSFVNIFGGSSGIQTDVATIAQFVYDDFGADSMDMLQLLRIVLDLPDYGIRYCSPAYVVPDSVLFYISEVEEVISF